MNLNLKSILACKLKTVAKGKFRTWTKDPKNYLKLKIPLLNYLNDQISPNLMNPFGQNWLQLNLLTYPKHPLKGDIWWKL